MNDLQISKVALEVAQPTSTKKHKWGKDSMMPEIWACVAAACSVQQYSVNMKHRQVCSSF